ncbi:hypothetical protein [Clostridium sp. ZBS2]|uniref:hypothetical protein n=1 Tax=Clostridium sp. ZBS2 TaxID=2949976 RepID=UPI00207A00BC|nr:hypothetical protein [Clostridium sp. ZBS2]
MSINSELKTKITSVVNNIDECWEKLITNQLDEAMKILDKIFIDFDYIINVSTKENIAIDIQKIYSWFVEMEKCLKAKDYTLQADILRYEIKPIINKVVISVK